MVCSTKALFSHDIIKPVYRTQISFFKRAMVVFFEKQQKPINIRYTCSTICRRANILKINTSIVGKKPKKHVHYKMPKINLKRICVKCLKSVLSQLCKELLKPSQPIIYQAPIHRFLKITPVLNNIMMI